MGRVVAASDNRLAGVADRWFPSFRDLVVGLLDSPSWDAGELEGLVRRGDFGAIVERVGVVKAEPTDVHELVLRVLVDAAGVSSAAGVSGSLSLSSPAAVLWASRLSGRLVRRVSAESRRAVRAVLVEALRSGGAPRVIARDLAAVVGLDARSAQAVVNYRAQLEAVLAEGRSPGRLVGRFGLAPSRLPAGAGGLGVEGRVDALVGRYRFRLLRRRGESIARTELQSAVHRGQRLVWDEVLAGDAGWRGRARRRWLTARDERLCFVCAPLDGATIGFDGSYESVSTRGQVVAEMPPAHPSCRCSESLVFED